MGIPVKLPVFEGPLDLLLHLIDKNKIDIYDIPIVEITEQYLDYIQQMEQENLDVMSEFMVMAATLLDIKCRMLLPKEVSEEGEEQDPREELVRQLLEYKMYKYMSYELRDRMNEASRSVYKKPTLPEEVLEYREPVDTGTALRRHAGTAQRRIPGDPAQTGEQDRSDPEQVRKDRERRGQPSGQDDLRGTLRHRPPALQLPGIAGSTAGENPDHRHVPGNPGTDENG